MYTSILQKCFISIHYKIIKIYMFYDLYDLVITQNILGYTCKRHAASFTLDECYLLQHALYMVHFHMTYYYK